MNFTQSFRWFHEYVAEALGIGKSSVLVVVPESSFRVQRCACSSGTQSFCFAVLKDMDVYFYFVHIVLCRPIP